MTDANQDLNVLVTGANRGIGLALVRAWAEAGVRVIATARRPWEADALTKPAARVEALDVTQPASVAQLADNLAGEAIDLLVHNAGILVNDRIGDVDPADVLKQLDVNAVGPLRVSLALRPHLQRAADAGRVPRIVFISSVMGSLAENTEGGWYGYRSSKAAANAVMRNLHADLEPWPVVALHPGYVQTRLTGGAGHITPETSAADLVKLIDRIDASMSGGFFDRFGEPIPW